MTDGYISAAEAYDRLDPHVTGSPAYTICPRARDGILTARAKVFFWGKERHEDCEIPKDFWWAGAEAALEQNWRAGDFSTYINQRLHCRAYGVTFLEADIDAIVPRSDRQDAGVELSFASSSDCVEQICEQAEIDPRTAVGNLVQHCAAGLLASKCARFWWRVTDRYDDQQDNEIEGEIPDWFWEQCADDPDTVFDWRSGKVSTRSYIEDDRYKVIVEGLQFDRQGIAELAAMLRSDATASDPVAGENTASARGGRKRDSEKWNAWIAELAAHIHDTGVPQGRGAEGQDELIAAIDSRLTEQGKPTLARSTVQSAARAVLLRLRSAGNADSG